MMTNPVWPEVLMLKKIMIVSLYAGAVLILTSLAMAGCLIAFAQPVMAALIFAAFIFGFFYLLKSISAMVAKSAPQSDADLTPPQA